MANRAANVKQSDLTRYLKAVRAAGVEVAQIKIARDGSVVIIPIGAGVDTGDNPCDRLLND